MKRLVTSLVSAAALWTTACSGGGSTITPPPPAGKFTLASLKGTYAFVTNGEVCAGSTCTPTSLARTGSFTADGTGNINVTANSVYDLVNFDGSGSAAIPITGGKYTMNSDGRGTLTLNVNSGPLASSLLFGIVLTSGSSGTTPASDGLMIDETSPATTNTNQSSTGSGNFVLQDTTAFQISKITGPYVFDFTGLDGNTNGPFPVSIVGQLTTQLTTTNTVQITGGFEDANDDFILTSGAPTGTLIPDPTNMATSGRGTASIGTQTFAFYVVDSKRVRFISTNAGTGFMLNGDAVAQDTTIPANQSAITSSFVFLVAGAAGDTGGGLTRVCRFTANGTSPLGKMFMDQNDATTQTQFNGLNSGTINSYDATTGRGVFSFKDSNGNTYTFVFYLSSASSGVIQDVSATPVSAVADGSLLAQSGSPFTSTNISGSYGLNWSGVVTNRGAGIQDEEDLVSQLKISSLSLAGTSDIFQFSSTNALVPNTNLGTNGQISFNNGDGTNGDSKRVSMSVTLSNQSAVNTVVYIVSPQLAFFANSDNNGTPRIVAGILKAQQ